MKSKRKILIFVWLSILTIPLLWIVALLTYLEIQKSFSQDIGLINKLSFFILTFALSVPTVIFSSLILYALKKTENERKEREREKGKSGNKGNEKEEGNGTSEENKDAELKIDEIKRKLKEDIMKTISVSNFFLSLYLLISGSVLISSVKRAGFPNWFFPFLLISPIAIIFYIIVGFAKSVFHAKRNIPEMKEIKREKIK